ncbi:uncharacterized protein LOC119180580 isoform X3 [Rhipicephalus microplus]|uniref:uncharacterized protein LOC119180580 isoform X3 n=1 Tax=Rhipicephalus microplus TaxID=6941 RepID=UPI003F6C416B
MEETLSSWFRSVTPTISLSIARSVSLNEPSLCHSDIMESGWSGDVVLEKSLQDGKSPIRGGIPLVFPNFGAWELGPHHGFAHTSLWSVQPSDEMQEGNVGKAVILSLEDNDCTRSIWNHGFRLVYRIELQKAKLRLELTVENTGTSTFEFTTLMHPYWRMEDVRKCTLSGCHGVLYADKTKDFCELREEREYVTISQWTDNIYKSTERVHMLTEVGTGKTLKIEKENLPDTVVWNPWAKMAAKLEDLDVNEYMHMLCVEPGHVVQPVLLEPSQHFRAACTFTACDG